MVTFAGGRLKVRSCNQEHNSFFEHSISCMKKVEHHPSLEEISRGVDNAPQTLSQTQWMRQQEEEHQNFCGASVLPLTLTASCRVRSSCSFLHVLMIGAFYLAPVLAWFAPQLQEQLSFEKIIEVEQKLAGMCLV